MRLIETHDAIFARIESAVRGQASVWDYVPPQEQTPYVVLGRMSLEYPNGLQSKLTEGYTVTQKIHVVTRAMEKHKAIMIMQRIQEAFVNRLTVVGTNVLRQQVLGGYVEETTDAEYYGELDLLLWLEDQRRI